ncbi:MAG: hypothetical protein U5J98_02105 [Halobacteriales archaeon]|nr:hypothetical protein [Halobacteriales archaeon]
MAAAGASVESVALLGATVGGALVAWQLVEPAARPYGRQGVLAAGGTGAVVAVGAAAVDPIAAAVFAGAALASAGVLLAPVARTRRLRSDG